MREKERERRDRILGSLEPACLLLFFYYVFQSSVGQLTIITSGVYTQGRPIGGWKCNEPEETSCASWACGEAGREEGWRARGKMTEGRGL